MDLLLSAAQTWRVLLDSEYNLIYGKKKKLYTVRLVFSPEDFYHNAGFQHLDDITFSHITSHPKTLDSVLSGTITQEMIQKSQNYLSFVEPRLKAIVYLQNLLESDFRTYMFNARKLPFIPRYRQNTLLSETSSDIVFLFTDADADDGHYFPRSIFVQDIRDYTINQTPIYL